MGLWSSPWSLSFVFIFDWLNRYLLVTSINSYSFASPISSLVPLPLVISPLRPRLAVRLDGCLICLMNTEFSFVFLFIFLVFPLPLPPFPHTTPRANTTLSIRPAIHSLYVYLFVFLLLTIWRGYYSNASYSIIMADSRVFFFFFFSLCCIFVFGPEERGGEGGMGMGRWNGVVYYLVVEISFWWYR